ncbi:MAG TPA: hypothetical protein VN176_03565 [Verrucomicrobiae bacterium]|jgi:hypothetical protein|nr:hypothetical protein [Verrucomicrobiae bacterium]
MIDPVNSLERGRRLLAALTCCVAAMGCATPSLAQQIAGTYVLLGDSDGTKPTTGARLQLTFTGATAGPVRLFAVRPGETVHDTGSYSTAGHQITIHFKEVDWAADRQPYAFDGCTLTLPFMAVSAASGPGTSVWQREDPKCSGQPMDTASAQPAKVHFNPFSADEVITQAAGQRRVVKVYATEKALRSESQENGQDTVTIVRFDRNMIWTLVPQKKSFSETSADFGGGRQPLQQDPLEPGCSVAGDEAIGSYRCSKVLCSKNLGGHVYAETRWAAKEIGGLIIKYTDNMQTLELENIKLVPLDPALFELPAGYKKTGP